MDTHHDPAHHLKLTSHLTPVRISEIVLKTSRFAAMKAWYQMALGVAPFFEHEPPAGVVLDAATKALGRAVDRRLCFIKLAIDYPYMQVLGIFEVPDLEGKAAREPGLDHMQFTCGAMKELVERYELLHSVGVEPYRCANHGQMTSIYYHDPDGNRVEFCMPNFPTEAEYFAYLKSDAFRRNPSGKELDPAAFAKRFHSGIPLADLVRIDG